MANKTFGADQPGSNPFSTIKKMSQKAVTEERARLKRAERGRREQEQLARARESEWGRHADAVAQMPPLARWEMARRHLELGLQLLQPWSASGLNRELFFAHAKVVIRRLCLLAWSGHRKTLASAGIASQFSVESALETAVDCTSELVDLLHDLDAQHPDALASFPRDERFFPPANPPKNRKRASVWSRGS